VAARGGDPDKLAAENRELRAENRRLKKESSELRAKLVELTGQVEELGRRQLELSEASAGTEELLRWLKARLQILERELGD
jgi:predicted RNase H-like nuclease (RuvC/YqgF family)